jgi:hypothetical protein
MWRYFSEFILEMILVSCKWLYPAVPKRRYPSTKLPSVASHKTLSILDMCSEAVNKILKQPTAVHYNELAVVFISLLIRAVWLLLNMRSRGFL